ncbi:MAG: usg protein, partial [Rickettsiales bacterium]|nr:usg protein [Rickettsiales bacterium]
MPDHPSLIQTYVWQEFDLAPDFPVLYKFLNFWERKLDGKLHSVTIASCEIIKPTDIDYAKDLVTLN